MPYKKSDPEVWQNNNLGEVAVIKLDRMGDPTHVIVRGRQKFEISPEERLLNQDRAADESLDVFTNGTLSPVRLVEGVEGYSEIASNPNLMSEDDLKAIFKLKAADFKEKLGGITNSVTLRRILEVAEDQDASVRQVSAVKARLEEVDPPRYVLRESNAGGVGAVASGERRPNPVTPR